ncbi:MAG: SpoIVB peptidase [Clostridia bacterium]|nr:SpoIVB peptidase [Clostridia bacterium]
MLIALVALSYGILYYSLPDRYSVFAGESEKLNTDLYTLHAISGQSAGVRTPTSAYTADKYTARLKLLGFLPIKTVTVDVITKQEIALGGQTFGIKLYTQGVIVVGCGNFLYQGKTVNPAYEAGIRVGDRLMSVDGEKITSNEQLQQVIAGIDRPVRFRVIRKNQQFDTTVTPVIPDGETTPRLGLWVRDSTAGLGTVTYYNRTTGRLGGLGHSVADIDTGEIMPSEQGSIVKADITKITKGTPGETGQLSGNFAAEQYGKLIANTEQGVFADCESGISETAPTIPIALRGEITTGKAQLYTQLDDQSPQYYDIEIEKIYNNLKETKNMVIRITDTRLLNKTGGIVQGMSGSPIVQNGKLIGAVTHVFIDDPTRGYGIFIEKMLLTENELNH